MMKTAEDQSLNVKDFNTIIFILPRLNAFNCSYIKSYKPVECDESFSLDIPQLLHKSKSYSLTVITTWSG